MVFSLSSLILTLATVDHLPEVIHLPTPIQALHATSTDLLRTAALARYPTRAMPTFATENNERSAHYPTPRFYLSRTWRLNSARPSILATFPPAVNNSDCSNLLLANVPGLCFIESKSIIFCVYLDRLLSVEERRCRLPGTFQRHFRLHENLHRQAFFPNIYQTMYGQLGQRLKVDEAILDHNYERLFKCINILAQERLRRFQTAWKDEQLPIEEYAVALEFYLQFDVDLFFMKTCAYRGAERRSPTHPFRGDQSEFFYGLSPCDKPLCLLCHPSLDLLRQRRQPIMRFSPSQKHCFANGYEAILNCPAVCAP